MRSLSSDIQAGIDSGQFRPFLIFDLTIDSTHFRYTDCDVPIAVSSTLFNPRGIKTEQIKYSLQNVVDSVRLEIDNIDQTLSTPFVGGTPQGAATKLQMVLLSTSYAVINSPVTLFQGNLDAWNLDEDRITMTLASEMVHWNQKTLAKYSPSCRWKVFKGTECKYSGVVTECDRTYATCVSLNNSDNFGGFRWLPSIIDKELWWGRTKA